MPFATVSGDDRAAAREHAVHHRGDRLRVEVLTERRRADDVEKEYGDLAKRLRGLVGRLAQCRQPCLQAAQRSVYHLVAELATLRLQRGYARIESMLLR